MAELCLKVLSENEIEKIHDQSLEILQKAGVRVSDTRLLDLLCRAGAKRDPGGDRVYLPRALVKELLTYIPSSFSVSRQEDETVTWSNFPSGVFCAGHSVRMKQWRGTW